MPANTRIRDDAAPRHAEQCDAGAPSTPSQANPGMQVTMVVRHRVSPSIVPMYEQWLARLAAAAQEAPGYLGAHLIRPVTDAGDYMFVPRFQTPEHLAAWTTSARWLALLDDVQRLLGAPPAEATPGATSAWRRLLRQLTGPRRA